MIIILDSIDNCRQIKELLIKDKELIRIFPENVSYETFNMVWMYNDLQENVLRECENILHIMITSSKNNEAFTHMTSEFNYKLGIVNAFQKDLDLMIFKLYSEKLEIIQNDINLEKELQILFNRMDNLSINMENNASFDSISEGFGLANDGHDQNKEMLEKLLSINKY